MLAVIRMRNRPGWKKTGGIAQIGAEIPQPMRVHVGECAVRTADPYHVGEVLGEQAEVGTTEAVGRILKEPAALSAAYPLCFASHGTWSSSSFAPRWGPRNGRSHKQLACLCTGRVIRCRSRSPRVLRGR